MTSYQVVPVQEDRLSVVPAEAVDRRNEEGDKTVQSDAGAADSLLPVCKVFRRKWLHYALKVKHESQLLSFQDAG